jgi:hypothetical protein
MTYYVVGRLFVERSEPDEGEDVGGYEILDSMGACSYPECDSTMELNETVFCDSDLPKEPGVYALMYGARVIPYQTYEGEHDVDVEIEWTKAIKLKEEAARTIFDEIENPRFEDLLKEQGNV